MVKFESAFKIKEASDWFEEHAIWSALVTSPLLFKWPSLDSFRMPSQVLLQEYKEDIDC